jgi:hypothetical protein
MQLSFRTIVACVLLTVVGLDVGVRLAYRTRDGLYDKTIDFSAHAPAGQNLVILGTCLPEQHIRKEQLATDLGVPVYNLGVQATNPLDWHLAFKNALPTDRVGALLVAYGSMGIETTVSPYESRVMELARAEDLPEILGQVCDTSECRSDLVLRWAWPTWRYRARIGNRLWKGLGAWSLQAPEQGAMRDYSAAALHFLDRLLATAEARAVPVWMLRLPSRDGEVIRDEGTARAEADAFTRHGARTLELGALPTQMFEDDAHLTRAGSEELTRRLAAELKGRVFGASADR